VSHTNTHIHCLYSLSLSLSLSVCLHLSLSHIKTRRVRSEKRPLAMDVIRLYSRRLFGIDQLCASHTHTHTHTHSHSHSHTHTHTHTHTHSQVTQAAEAKKGAGGNRCYPVVAELAAE
jgi:hypothetical protein